MPLYLPHVEAQAKLRLPLRLPHYLHTPHFPLTPRYFSVLHYAFNIAIDAITPLTALAFPKIIALLARRSRHKTLGLGGQGAPGEDHFVRPE